MELLSFFDFLFGGESQKKIRLLKKNLLRRIKMSSSAGPTEPRYFLVAYAMTDISFFDFFLSQETKVFWGFTVPFVVCYDYFTS